MKKLLIYDWKIEGSNENPYYSFVEKDKFNLKFCESFSQVMEAGKKDIDCIISHYGIGFNKNIQKKIINNLPVISYRNSPEGVKIIKDFYKLFNLPDKDLYFVEKDRELGNLLGELFY